MQPNVSGLASSLHSDYTLGAPIDLGEMKIIPAWRSMVAAAEFAALAVITPAAIIVVRGDDVKVLTFNSEVGEEEILERYQGG